MKNFGRHERNFGRHERTEAERDAHTVLQRTGQKRTVIAGLSGVAGIVLGIASPSFSDNAPYVLAGTVVAAAASAAVRRTGNETALDMINNYGERRSGTVFSTPRKIVDSLDLLVGAEGVLGYTVAVMPHILEVSGVEKTLFDLLIACSAVAISTLPSHDADAEMRLASERLDIADANSYRL